MRRLALALIIVIMTSGTAMAHGRFFFGINLGVPVFQPFAYPGTYYYGPAPPPGYYTGGPVIIIDRPHNGSYYRDHGVRDHDRHRFYGERYNHHSPGGAMIRR